MPNSTSEGGGDDGSLLWMLIKYGVFIIGAIVVLGFVLNLISGLFPFLVIAALAYLGYRLFLKGDDDSAGDIEQQEPLLLDHQETILDDEDPLERKFRELEANQSRTDR